MTRTWIVVADSARARIFAPAEQGKKLRQIKNMLHDESRGREQDLTTDRPGRAFDSEGMGRHAMSESVSPKEREARKFCKELADELDAARLQDRFDRLVLVAGPAFLGELRKTLTDQTSRLVVSELDKNLVQMEDEEIPAHMPADIWE